MLIWKNLLRKQTCYGTMRYRNNHHKKESCGSSFPSTVWEQILGFEASNQMANLEEKKICRADLLAVSKALGTHPVPEEPRTGFSNDNHTETLLRQVLN